MTWLSDKTLAHLQTVAELPDLSGTEYQCLERIATGGMATVYVAKDTKLNRKVAIKILGLPDAHESLVQRMKQEAQVIAKLEHPGIVPIHDVGTLADGRVFYVMKLVVGTRLDNKVRAGTPLPSLLRLFQKVCEAVAFAHDKQIIHRDLKPENIMVGSFGEVLVMDWGLAKVLADTDIEAPTGLTRPTKSSLAGAYADAMPPTEHGTIMGTPEYMSPEQAEGKISAIDTRTDVFSLGAILNFFLKARAMGRVGKELRAIVAKAMSPNPVERYNDAIELVADINSCLNGEKVSAYKENFLETLWRLAKQHKLIIILILSYVIAKSLVIFLENL